MWIQYRCEALIESGSWCNYHEMCRSNHCYFVVGDVNLPDKVSENFCYQCIAASDKSSDDFGKDLYDHCYDDEFCSNEENFTCQQKRDLNDSCTSRYACKSGHCIDNRCE